MERIAVIGGGAWGTALAQVCCLNHRDVVIWARESDVVTAINSDHENTPFLPGLPLDASLRASTDLAVVADADLVLLVTPAQFLRPVSLAMASHLRDGTPLVICSKGVEKGSFALMSEVLGEVLPGQPVAVLSGPTFAKEVAAGLPTAVTLACGDADLGRRMLEALGSNRFRPYLGDDVIGAQIGGAIKNIMAIACGIVDGRAMGDNARAALMTRGLAEMLRYGQARGARPETLMGLSGLGDLSLTCNSSQSRNMSLGIEIGRGGTAADILGQRNSVAEGVTTAQAVASEVAGKNLEMPICSAVDAICNHHADLDVTIQKLMTRPLTSEFR